MMRSLPWVLLLLLLALQYPIWFGQYSVFSVASLKDQSESLHVKMQKLSEHNQAMSQSLARIQSEPKLIKRIARIEHHMIDEDEEFYQIIE